MTTTSKKTSSSKMIFGLQVGISALLLTVGWAGYQNSAATNESFAIVKAEKQKALDIGKLESELKSIQISVVQVQQFLSDVSATRGLDGLNDGFDLAEENARSFEAHLKSATALAAEMKEDGIGKLLKTVSEAFPPYYAKGKEMAKIYVAEGPAGGNKMMGAFDEYASALTGDMDKALKTTSDRKREIEEAGIASVSGVEATLASNKQFFQMLTIILGGLAFLFSAGTALLTVVLQRQATRQQARAEELARIQEQEREENSRNTSLVITSLGEGLDKLAKGDLSANIQSPFPGEMEALRKNFNASVHALSDTITSVIRSSEQIKAGTSEIAGASGDLARRTENQAASLEETAASILQLSTALNETAANAAKAKASATSAREMAENGRSVVAETVSSMKNISTSAAQMTSIISVIDEIAFQTNLLALNAGIEAARAGDAGKGFAVVAGEVRILSDRSAEAAKDIKKLLEESNANVDQGVKLVSVLDASLSSINQQAVTVAQVIEEISHATKSQADSLTEVSAAVNQLDQFTQANAAMVEQSTAATHTLNSQTEELFGAIGKFNVEAANDTKQISRPRLLAA